MWITAGGPPAWIRFEFDKVHKLDEMWVWNCNQLVEPFVGFSAKNVVIEYSAEGQTGDAGGNARIWQSQRSEHLHGQHHGRFRRGPGPVRQADHREAGRRTLPTGLSEVRFFSIPVQAREPQPADAATDVSVETRLSWRPGREAITHRCTWATTATP